MSYAKAAKENKPATQGTPATTSEVPPVKDFPTESAPKGSVEVIPEEQLKEFTPKLQDTNDSKIKDFSKELQHAKEKSLESSRSIFDAIYKKLSQGYQQLQFSASKIGVKAQSTGGCAIQKASIELQNPVVLAQLGVGITGAVAGYFAYLERSRINTSNNVVLAIHGAIITGLVGLDAYLFSKFYPKYKKN